MTFDSTQIDIYIYILFDPYLIEVLEILPRVSFRQFLYLKIFILEHKRVITEDISTIVYKVQHATCVYFIAFKLKVVFHFVAEFLMLLNSQLFFIICQ